MCRVQTFGVQNSTYIGDLTGLTASTPTKQMWPYLPCAHPPTYHCLCTCGPQLSTLQPPWSGTQPPRTWIQPPTPTTNIHVIHFGITYISGTVKASQNSTIQHWLSIKKNKLKCKSKYNCLMIKLYWISSESSLLRLSGAQRLKISERPHVDTNISCAWALKCQNSDHNFYSRDIPDNLYWL